MSKTKTGSNTPFIGGSKTVTVIDGCLYGYAGAEEILTNETRTMFDFYTGNYTSIIKLQGGRNDKVSAEMGVFVYLNGVLVYYAKTDNGTQIPLTPYFSEPLHLIIPPNTHVEIKQSSEDASTQDTTCVLTGKIAGKYG